MATILDRSDVPACRIVCRHAQLITARRQIHPVQHAQASGFDAGLRLRLEIRHRDRVGVSAAVRKRFNHTAPASTLSAGLVKSSPLWVRSGGHAPRPGGRGTSLAVCI